MRINKITVEYTPREEDAAKIMVYTDDTMGTDVCWIKKAGRHWQVERAWAGRLFDFYFTPEGARFADAMGGVVPFAAPFRYISRATWVADLAEPVFNEIKAAAEALDKE